MKDLQKNTVPSANQNIKWFFKYGGEGHKILFVGNSTSKHGPKPSIGWTRDCGMAASCPEKDYVHLVAKMAQKYDPDLSFAVLQVASFEGQFETYDIASEYADGPAYDADIIVMLFGTNVPKTYDTREDHAFIDAYEKMRNFLDGEKKPKFFHVEQFFVREKIIADRRAVAEKYGEPFIELGSIKTDEATHGEYNHPNDYGMQCIADKIWEAIEPAVKEICGK